MDISSNKHKKLLSPLILSPIIYTAVCEKDGFVTEEVYVYLEGSFPQVTFLVLFYFVSML